MVAFDKVVLLLLLLFAVAAAAVFFFWLRPALIKECGGIPLSYWACSYAGASACVTSVKFPIHRGHRPRIAFVKTAKCLPIRG